MAVGFGESEPGFGDIAHAFQFLLHFVVLDFHRIGVGIRWDLNRWRENDHGTTVREWKQEVVPGFFKSLAVFDADVKDRDGATSATSQHDWTGLGDVARAARAINGEGAVLPFHDALCHDGEAAQAAAR